MSINAKAMELSASLANELDRRTALTVTESISATTDFPLIRVGSASAGNEGALIRCRPQEFGVAVNIIGDANRVYAPTMIQVCFEQSATANVALTTLDDLAVIVALCAKRGARLEIYQSTNGDNPDEDDFVASKLVKTIDASDIYGMVGNV